MVIGGLEKLSLSDFPGKIAAVIFTLGCNLRCRYCHNPGLVDPKQYSDPLPVDDVLHFLSSRIGILQGVVLSGGEPTIHPDLEAFVRNVRSLGFAIKLDTNGTNPTLLRKLVAAGLLDYVALDVKAPIGSYSRIAGTDVDTSSIIVSLAFLRECGIDYEVRTTYSDTILSNGELLLLAQGLGQVRRYVLQGYRASTTLDPAFRALPDTSPEVLGAAGCFLKTQGLAVVVRPGNS
jgi:pyruvate formate lyase activating enzyme